MYGSLNMYWSQIFMVGLISNKLKHGLNQVQMVKITYIYPSIYSLNGFELARV
jgi:hypothetical protein